VRQRHIPELDGLRGVAILLVILFHFHRAQWITGFWWTGVDLFFALSGFLITGILLDGGRGTRVFRNFYARRCLRILPLYYLTLIVVFSLTRVPAGEQLWYWFHLSNWPTAYDPLRFPWVTQFWSLAIEEQFYLMWPLVVMLCRRRTVVWTALGLIAAAVALRNLPGSQQMAHAYSNYIYRLTPFRVDTLLMGSLAALAYRDEWWRRIAERWWMGIAGAGAAIAIACMAADHSMSAFTEWTMRLGYTGGAMFWAAVVTGAAIYSGSRAAWVRVLRAGVLREFGKYSYCLYIIHPAVLAWLGAGVKAMAVMYVAAMASWYGFERPFLKLRTRFR